MSAPGLRSEPPRAPLLSIVVPSYDMAPYLALTLRAIGQLRPCAVELEVIVVDDGSTDATAAVVAAAARERSFELRCVRRERDALSCRSRARNLGVAESRGEYLLFLDAGVLPHPELLQVLERRWRNDPETREEVLTLGTLGLFTSQLAKPAETWLERLRSLSALELSATMTSLAGDPAWYDRRQPWFDSVQGQVSRLPAPWLFAWSCALGVPRRAFLAVEGFDEAFTMWGAEDCDLGLRLFRSEVRFHALAAPTALHIPHPSEAATSRMAQHARNVRRLHAKSFSREGELFVVLEDPFAASTWALRLDRAPLEHLLPSWDSTSCDDARRIAGDLAGALMVGAPAPELVAGLPGATWAVPSRPLFENVIRALGNNLAKLSVGCHLNEPDGGRHCAILTDLLRLLPEPLQAAQLREAMRVGRRALLFCLDGAPDTSSVEREIAGFPFSSLERLRAIARGIGLELSALPTTAARLRAYAIQDRG